MTDPGLPAIALDVHAHLAPVVPDQLAVIDGVSWDEAARLLHVDGHTVGVRPLFEPGQLLAWMDRNRVEHAWVSAPPPLYRQHLQGAPARDWADYLNGALAAIADASAGRLGALFHLPTQDPDMACSIAEAAIDGGHRRFSMPTGTGDERGLSDPAFEPLWRALDRSNGFVFLHPGECADGRLQAFYLSNLLGNPYESTVALAHLAFARVPERFPGMTLCLAHGGGLAPMVAGRWERGFATARPGVNLAGPGPTSQLGRVYVDCICHARAALDLADEVFGADKVVFGSDWPFPMGLIDPAGQLADCARAQRERYLTSNPRGLMRRLHGP